MSWMKFAVAAIVGVASTPALAMPSLGFVDNGDSTGTFTLTPDPTLFDTAAGGSLAFEIDITVTTGAIESGGTTGNAPLFPRANPGQLEGTNLTGSLFNGLDLDGSTVRGAFGSDLFTTGDTVDAFIVDLEGAGELSYTFIFAQDGTAFPAGDPLVAGEGMGSITDGGGVVDGDFNADGRVDNGDLNLLLGSWGDPTVPAEWVNGFVPNVDNGELNALLGDWGFGTSVAIPEPTSMLLMTVAGFGFFGARRNG